jgi:hypothetical protein
MHLLSVLVSGAAAALASAASSIWGQVRGIGGGGGGEWRRERRGWSQVAGDCFEEDVRRREWRIGTSGVGGGLRANTDRETGCGFGS